MRTSQRRTARPYPPTATMLPSGLRATAKASPSSPPDTSAIRERLATSHTWARGNPEPAAANATRLPSALNATSGERRTLRSCRNDSPCSTSQNDTPPPVPLVASVLPSGLKATFASRPAKNGSYRDDRDETSHTVVAPLLLTAASVAPSGEKASALTSPPVFRSGAPEGMSVRASQRAIPLVLEADRDQPAVGAEPSWVAVGDRVEGAIVRKGERPPEPAPAREIPGDRRPVVAHRVQRVTVAAEDSL